MKFAAAYIRVSDDRQDEYSPDSQLKLVREYAKRNGYILPDEYVFYDDGISAKSVRKRTSFNNMIALAKDKSHPFDAILVWKFSRFARNQEESIVYKSLLKKAGVQVLSVSEPISDDPFGSLIERIIEWMDEYYLIRLSGEVKRGMLEKASRGEAMCHPAFGYDIINKKYVPNADAEIVRSIFEKYRDGMPMKAIAVSLYESGVKTYRGNPPDNRFVDYILNNPVYIGKIRWSSDGRQASKRNFHGENVIIVDGIHAPIISDDLWTAVQERLADTKKKYGKYQRREQPVDWMLKGLCRCSSCGATLVYVQTKCPSMQCYRYSSGRGCTVSHALSINKANKAVIAYLKDACERMDFNFAAAKKEPSSHKTDYSRAIADCERKLKKCKDAYLAGVDTLEEYAAHKKTLSEQISDYKQKAAAEDAASAPVDLLEFRDRVLATLDIVTSPDMPEFAKNESLRTIIDHVVYQKSTKQIDIFFK